MLVLFGFAARYAVRHAITAAQAAHRHARPAEPARNGVLIINPNSGGGKAERFNLPEEARKRRRRAVAARAPATTSASSPSGPSRRVQTSSGWQGATAPRRWSRRWRCEHDVAHVCVPAGTRNHFALDLGLDRDDVVGALDAFTDGVERRIDLASLNERIFVNNASLGVYARVVQIG